MRNKKNKNDNDTHVLFSLSVFAGHQGLVSPKPVQFGEEGGAKRGE